MKRFVGTMLIVYAVLWLASLARGQSAAPSQWIPAD